MKKRMNNKGFSLVELIVVMAIMAILAVTLAPRLMHYVEKARKASDQEVINTILNVASLSLVDESLRSDFQLNANSSSGIYTLDLNADLDSAATGTQAFYNIQSDKKSWSVSSVAPKSANALCYNEIKSAVGDFKLKSTEADADTKIKIIYDSSTDVVTTTLYYDGTTSSYSISSR